MCPSQAIRDAYPYSAANDYDNWDLSSDRANASRRFMVSEAGFPLARIAYVAGKADTDHLIQKDPYSPTNRRISIVLLYKNAKLNEGKPEAPVAPDNVFDSQPNPVKTE